MDFLSDCYKKIKLGVGSLGGIGSIVLILIGVISTKGVFGVFLIGGGSLWFTSSGFILFDAIHVNSIIKRDVDRLRKTTLDFQFENNRLKNNVNSLEQIKKGLLLSMEESETQVTNLTNLKTAYEKNIFEYKKIAKEERKNSEKLSKNIKVLEGIKMQLNQNIKKLNTSLDKNKTIVKELEIAKNQYIDENKKLQETNQSSEIQLKELTTQVTKLKALYKSTQLLLKNLATAGDMFNEFGETIGNVSEDLKDTNSELNDTKEEYDKTLERMNNLLEKMKNSSFTDLDKDKDGTITKDEYLNYVK